MTRELRTTDLLVGLGAGTWTVRWPGVGITAGPCSARVLLDGRLHDTAVGEGAWRVETGPGFGRPGAWARWRPKGNGPALHLHVPADGDTVVVQVVVRTATDARLDRLVPITGSVDLGGDVETAVRLVEGYDSWSYAGVRAATAPGRSWWRAAFVRAGDRGALAVHALDAARFATVVESAAGADAVQVAVDCGAAPAVELAPGSWGYEVLAPPALDLPVAAGTPVRSPPIAVAAGTDPFALLEQGAELAGVTSGRRRWTGAPIGGWESWYHYGLFVEPAEILANARLLRARFGDRPGFDMVQVDDGWQLTYGAWWPNDRFPADLATLVDALHDLGCRAGLWLAPFMVQPGAPGVATDHPDWLVRDVDGAPVLDRHGRAAIDGSRADVLEWMRDLGAQVRAWGFEMVKLDFLYLGATGGARADAGVTGTEALRRGLRAFVDGLGDGVYVLGCGAPLLPLVGLCHGNRVGHDLGVPVRLREYGNPLAHDWTGFHGIRPQARNVAARWALHRRWFECDPDVVMAWGSEEPAAAGGFALEESRTLATLAALCGGPYLLADDLGALRPAEREVVEDRALLDLAHGDGFRPLDLFDHADDPPLEEFFDQPAHVPSRWQTAGAGTAVEAHFDFDDADRADVPAHGVRLVRPDAPRGG
jgi:alpha-galactosidase